MKVTTLSFLSLSLACLMLAVTTGCKKGDGGGNRYLSIGTAPIGGAFAQVGGALSEVLNDSKGDNAWQVQASGTKGSQENIRLLDQGKIEFALCNAAISYFASRGEASWDKKHDIRVVMTLAPNVAMFITTKGSGIDNIAGLKDKGVVIGPAGAGFQMFVEPIVEAHGLKWDEMSVKHAGQSDAVGQLGDGVAAAAFLGGAVPPDRSFRHAARKTLYFYPSRLTRSLS
jgi:TRAP transporter TAXI family solute receptor